jgi:hypothetical protein
MIVWSYIWVFHPIEKIWLDDYIFSNNMHADNLQVHKIFVAQFEYCVVKSFDELKVASIILQLECQYLSTQMK